MSAAIERILVAMDPSPASAAACRTAAELAAQLRAELVGMFVEDVDLVRSAELPATREIGDVTGHPRPLEAGDLEAQLRIHARRTRAVLELVAEAVKITASFRIARTRTRIKRARPAPRPGPIRAVLDDVATAPRVAAAAAALADRAGAPVALIGARGLDLDALGPVEYVDGAELEAHLLAAGGPIVVAAASPLASDPPRLARLASDSGAVIALVR